MWSRYNLNSVGYEANLADLFLSPARTAEAVPPTTPTAVRDSARVNMASRIDCVLALIRTFCAVSKDRALLGRLLS